MTERMTGVVIVVHGEYGAPLLRAAEQLVGPIGAALVEVPLTGSVQELRERVEQAVRERDQGQGALVLTDLCGSTPANICQQVLAAGESELVTGVNLPMLVKLSTCDRRLPARRLAADLRRSTQQSVRVGSDLVRKGGSRGD
jgi:mannose PTS system EIIA component